MSCGPTIPEGRTRRALGLAGTLDARRSAEAMQTLWVAPWRAWWTVAFEALDPKTYGLPRGSEKDRSRASSPSSE